MDYDDIVPIAENVSKAIVEKIPVDISDYRQAMDLVYDVVIDVLLTDLN